MIDSLNAPVAYTPTTTSTSAQAAMTLSCTNTKRTNIADDYHIETHGMTGDVLWNLGTDRLSTLFEQENGCGSDSWTWIWDNDGHAVSLVISTCPWV